MELDHDAAPPTLIRIDTTTYRCAVCGAKTVVLAGSAAPRDCGACYGIVRRRTTQVPLGGASTTPPLET